MRRTSMCVAVMALAGLMLSGCASTPHHAPDPDMTTLVPVNKTIPPQLAGQYVMRPAQADKSNGGQHVR